MHRIQYDSAGISGLGRHGCNNGQPQRRAGQRGHFPRNAEKRQAVSTVGRELEGQQVIVEIEVVANALPHRRIGRQFQQAGGFRSDAEFLGGTQHAEALDAAHLGLLDLDARQHGANEGAGHFQAESSIRGTADDLQLAVRTGIHFAEAQAVGIGMFFAGDDLSDDDIGEGRGDRIALFDFETGHGQQVGQRLAVEGGIDEATQPGFGKLHERAR